MASISPLAQVRAGHYAVPTYIAHGTKDEVAPFAAAERFVDAMNLTDTAIPCEFLAVPGARHLFDLGVEEGTGDFDNLVAPGYDFLSRMMQ